MRTPKQPSLFDKSNYPANTLTAAEYRQLNKKKPTQREGKLQTRVCKEFKLRYPDVIFNCDLASGMKLTKGMAGLYSTMRSCRGLPDLTVYEPRRGYHGLCIELKADGVKVHKENGELYSDKHLKEQAEVLKRMQDKGYYAVFGKGWNHIWEVINWYMEEKSV